MAGKSGDKSKTSNGKKRVSDRTGSRLENKKIAAEEEKGLKHEIVLWIILGGCILLLVSNLGLGGKAGNVFSQFSFGLFGFFNHLLPIVLFILIAFDISNKNHRLIHLKIIAEVIFIVLICTLIQIITTDYNPEIKFLEYYKTSSVGKNGGGIVGGVFSKLLVPTFGSAGTYVFILISMIICIVIITGKSVMKGVRKGSSKVYKTAKEDSLRRKERNLHKQEAKSLKKEKRVNKVVKGVAIDTKIEKRADHADEIHEITKESMVENPYPENIWEPSVEPDNTWETIDIQPTHEDFSMDTNVEEVTYVQEQEPPLEDTLHTRVPKKQSSAENSTGNKSDSETLVIPKDKNQESKKYVFPPLSLLKKNEVKNSSGIDKHLKETAFKLQKTLGDFGVGVTITNVSKGPAVTRYELQPEHGVKVSKIVSLSDDIKLNLAAADIRIEAPIPGKAAIGIEVPNKENTAVMLRDLLEEDAFKKHPSNIAFAVGRDISGQAVVADIAKMPHLLIAGATGSGKSVCINTIIMSILYKSSPEDVKLIMIDPKVVELSIYNGIPHLFIPVVTDPKKAAGALNWAVAEMSDRYKKFAELNVRDLKGYNEKIKTIENIDEEDKPTKLPQIVIIVDELADLMMVAPGEVEDAICRLAQLARAAGLHLILATQRPSVNVITGLIKANMPSRIAFSVSSGVDSRTIIDMNGAEKLLGKGDMLFYPTGYQKPARVQGVFVSDKEVSKVVEFLTSQYEEVVYNTEIEEKINNVQANGDSGTTTMERDAYFVEAGKFIIEKEKASIGMLQRVFRIGFNRAARIMDQLSEAGVVGEEEGTKPRKVLMTMEEFEEYIDEYV